MKHLRYLLIIGLIAWFFLPAYAADWQLDSERSAITYLSSKQATIDTSMIFESNLFHKFSASIKDSQLELTIDLSSLDTKVAIRDERVAEHVFLTQQYPYAVVTATIDDIEQITYQRLQTTAMLAMRGQSHSVQAELIIERINPDTLRIQTVTPVLVDANAYGMLEGFAKLKALVGLMQIPTVIPVSLHLVFNAQ
ncbi:MAG: YceI family protein [Chromatiales bacterium]|nr:YceI family protein [Chromatiales bacterium]